MTKYLYGVELYSVKDELERDFQGTLKKVKTMGYKGVEFAGEMTHPASVVKQALDEVQLICCGWHTPWSAVQDDRLEATIDYFKTVGNQYVIIPGLPEDMMNSREKIIETAAVFNAIAARLGEQGMQLGFHNHAGQLKLYADGACPLTVLFDHTDDSVIVQIDNGHVVNGRGFDLMKLVRRYPGRLKTVHLKPYDLKKGAAEPEKGYQTMIGEDDVPWSDFMRECQISGGTEWFIVEYESPEMYAELDGVRICLERLMTMEKEGRI